MSLAEHTPDVLCDCGGAARQMVVAFTVWSRPDIYYTSPIDGRPITSEAARRDDLARNNCEPYDPGMKQDYQRRIKEGEERLEKGLDDTVERVFDAMPSAKKEKLAAELSDGLTVAPERQTAAKSPVTVKPRS